jgi:RimJ/RimL family protein N-acetyltransferase
VDAPWVLREATPADAAAMLAFMDALLSEGDVDIPLQPGEFDIPLEQEEGILQEYADADNAIFLLAELEGEIIGLLNLRGGRRAALRHVADLGISIALPWRGKGVGNSLMVEAVSWARANPVLKRIELNVYARNAAGIHLYKKHGFEIEGRRRSAIYQGGEYLDDLIMAVMLD